ncbi:hypothetical protein P154DRAFT_564941 [Amniculicola lignicola CBS 123094]|uniref:Uncharacterized protein n=1 Tax=Amniculicola lignicola CBS 123094 TaxID=1392246 RepID=A0A6A5W9W4_9PLEO|nr:hypothetical protein P154DRAFT_564941 [Amniculicola lignicola CBS 123094]
MNPNTSTRKQFTDYLVSSPMPESATTEYKELATKLKALLKLLAEHKAMEENLTQTYMTPAAYKNKIYFMWDFIGRTLGQLSAIDPSEARPGKPAYDEAKGRAMYAGELISGPQFVLDSMCPDPRKEGVQFGGEIVGIAGGFLCSLIIVTMLYHIIIPSNPKSPIHH